MYGKLSGVLGLKRGNFTLVVAVYDMLPVLAVGAWICHCDFDLFSLTTDLLTLWLGLGVALLLPLLVLEPVLDEPQELVPFGFVLDLFAKVHD